MTTHFRTFAGLFAAASLLLTATASFAQDKPADQIRIGLQKSSTLIAVLRANGELEKALAPLGVKVSWAEFSSGLPLLESLGVGNLDFGADVADTVPIFAQAAGSKLAYVAEESASPAAQAILVSKDSPIKSLADLKGKKVAVTKGAGSHYLLLAALGKAGLNFKDISPAYLAPADGRAAFVSNNVDAWVAWDPFLTSAQRQSGAKVLSDGSGGLASYKRYYLASETFADRRSDVLNIVFAKLRDTGKWVKGQSEGSRRAARRFVGHRRADRRGSQQPSQLRRRRGHAGGSHGTTENRRRILRRRADPEKAGYHRRQDLDAETRHKVMMGS